MKYYHTKYLFAIFLLAFLLFALPKAYSQEDEEFKIDKTPMALNLSEVRSKMKYPPEAVANEIESKVIVTSN